MPCMFSVVLKGVTWQSCRTCPFCSLDSPAPNEDYPPFTSFLMLLYPENRCCVNRSGESGHAIPTLSVGLSANLLPRGIHRHGWMHLHLRYLESYHPSTIKLGLTVSLKHALWILGFKINWGLRTCLCSLQASLVIPETKTPVICKDKNKFY